MNDPRHMVLGVDRRMAIMRLVSEQGELSVNRKYCLQTKHDSDLKKLLKQGKLVRERKFLGRKQGYTIVRLPD